MGLLDPTSAAVPASDGSTMVEDASARTTPSSGTTSAPSTAAASLAPPLAAMSAAVGAAPLATAAAGAPLAAPAATAFPAPRPPAPAAVPLILPPVAEVQQEHSEPVRVAVRVRPFIESDSCGGGLQTCAVAMVGQSTRLRTEEGLVQFQSDVTFWSHDPKGVGHATQQDVFHDLGVPLLRSGLAGFNGCLVAYGQTGAGKSYTVLGEADQPGVLPRLVEGLLQERSWAVGGGTGGSSAGFELRVWLSAVEIYSERLRDLLSPVCLPERSERLAFVEHPTLGVQLLGATEAPCLEATDAQQLLDYAARKRAATAVNAGGRSSSRSHALFVLRLEVRQGNRNMHSKVVLADLAGSERRWQQPSLRSPSRSGIAINHSLAVLGNVVRELAESSRAQALDRSCVPFQVSHLTFALKDALAGNSRTWFLAAIAPGVTSADETAATLRFAESVRRLRTGARPNIGSWADACALLQADALRLHLQLSGSGDAWGGSQMPSDPSERRKLVEEMGRPWQVEADEGARQARERAKALESLGVLVGDAAEAFSLEQVTPYLMNMSDDVQLAGRLVYFLRRGAETTIGSSPSCSIVIGGLGVLPELCQVVNHDNVHVTLQRRDECRWHVRVNGQVAPSRGPLPLYHHDRLYLGFAMALRLHIPMQAEVETINESEEHTGLRPPPPIHELVLNTYPQDLLPKLPDRSESLSEIQFFMEHSASFSELQLYMEDLYDRLGPERGHTFFKTLQEACHLVDEANMITVEVREEEKLHFEVEFVWDIFRAVEDILMVRLMYWEDPSQAKVLLYWTYRKFRQRLDMMRDVGLTFHHTGLKPTAGSGDAVDDPWTDPSTADLQQRLLVVLMQEERRRRLAATTGLAPPATDGPGGSPRGAAAARAQGMRPPTHLAPVSTESAVGPMAGGSAGKVASVPGRPKKNSPGAVGMEGPPETNGAAAMPAPLDGMPHSPPPQRSVSPRLVTATSSARSGAGVAAAAAEGTAEAARLRELVASLQEQLQAVKEKTDSIDLDGFRDQMLVMRSMLAGAMGASGGATGSSAAMVSGGGSTTSLAAVDGLDLGASGDLQLPAPFGAATVAAGEPNASVLAPSSMASQAQQFALPPMLPQDVAAGPPAPLRRVPSSHQQSPGRDSGGGRLVPSPQAPPPPLSAPQLQALAAVASAPRSNSVGRSARLGPGSSGGSGTVAAGTLAASVVPSGGAAPVASGGLAPTAVSIMWGGGDPGASASSASMSMTSISTSTAARWPSGSAEAAASTVGQLPGSRSASPLLGSRPPPAAAAAAAAVAASEGGSSSSAAPIVGTGGSLSPPPLRPPPPPASRASPAASPTGPASSPVMQGRTLLLGGGLPRAPPTAGSGGSSSSSAPQRGSLHSQLEVGMRIASCSPPRSPMGRPRGFDSNGRLASSSPMRIASVMENSAANSGSRRPSPSATSRRGPSPMAIRPAEATGTNGTAVAPPSSPPLGTVGWLPSSQGGSPLLPPHPSPGSARRIPPGSAAAVPHGGASGPSPRPFMTWRAAAPTGGASPPPGT